MVSLGCPKNLVDSERMLGLLKLDGYELVSDPKMADFAVINTCGFIQPAREESFAAIEEMLQLKRQGTIRGVIVTGCLAERQQESLLEVCPEIDHLVGVFGREAITQVADRLVGNLQEQRTVFRPAPTHPLPDKARLRVTHKHFAFLKISEGCDRLCTFCAIPKMRGPHASKSIEDVLCEARELADDGVRELIVVAQDTTYYGIDRYGKPCLETLLTGLEQIDGIVWIRLMYLYPLHFSDSLIDLIARSDKILPYLDIPLQHINDQMLRRMCRRVNRKSSEVLLNKLRRRIDNLVIRTTMITGFPGETETHFEELVAFVIEQQFERLGVFPYSLEPDTPAARLPDQVSPEIREARRAKLMLEQQQIALRWNEAKKGEQLDVLIDCAVPGEEAWIGRTYADAPDVDSVVYVTGDGIAPGQIVPCEIVSHRDYDLVGVAIDSAR